MKKLEEGIIKVRCKLYCDITSNRLDHYSLNNFDTKHIVCGEEFKPNDGGWSCDERITFVDWVTLIRFKKYLEVLDDD